MNRRNPTSPIRTGFDYQDFWGLKLCGVWLQNPSKYQWIWFETIPLEELSNDFFLDDILLLDKNGQYHLYQIKHKQNPDKDNWDWDELLKQEKGANSRLKNSLIQKWFKSIFKESLKGKIAYAAFVTNGLPSHEIQNFLSNEKIDIQKLRTTLPGIYDRILTQLLDTRKINEFFSTFSFSFGNKSITEIEKEIREFFTGELRATKAGIDSLLLQIHAESRRPITEHLVLDQIRHWCEFDRPRHLNERFAIPDDFEFFDTTTHEQILKDLQDPAGGIKVIYGKPGTGKSTYLSKLTEVLKEKNILSIRHHYHISPTDPNPLERLQAQRVNEALKAQIKEFQEEMGSLANKNSQNVEIYEFISQIAQHAKTRNTSFVFIIDGLDHVLRQGDEEELRQLINSVFFPQPGLWIIFGMQEIAEQYLPQAVFDRLPKDKWVEIKGLNRAALDRILIKNSIGLKLPDQRIPMKELSDELFQVTRGNPLHLRYSLHQLKNILNNQILTNYAFRFLLPYSGEITNYYDSLWRKLPELAKTVAITIASTAFQFKKTQLFDLMALMTGNPAEISEAFQSISHLLLEKRQKLSVYHTSFESFLIDQHEFQEQEIAVKRQIKNWLTKSNFEDLKWAELRKLEYFFGNSQPILQINREWLIDAICSLRKPQQIISQLELAKKAAFEAKRYGKVLEFSTLNDYFQNATESAEESYKKIWEIAFFSNTRDLSEYNLDELSPTQIESLVRATVDQGDFGIINEAIDELNYFHRHLSIKQKGEIGSELPRLPVSILNIVALDRTHEPERIHRYISQFRESGWSIELFGIYGDVLLKKCELSKIDILLKLHLLGDESLAILTKCAQYDISLRQKRFYDLIASVQHQSLNLFCLLYLVLHSGRISYLPPLPSYESFPSKVPEYESGKRLERAKLFSENFILGLLYTLDGKEAELQKWIDGAGSRWPLEIMSSLFRCAVVVAKNLQDKKTLSLKAIFETVDTVKALKWPENRDLYELQICFTTSLSLICQTVLYLKAFLQQGMSIEENELSTILKCRYYNRSKLLDLLIEHDSPLLDTNSYEKFVFKEMEIWENRIVTFQERSEHYADLAKLSAIHKDGVRRDGFTKLAAENLIGYGYHKDLFLDSVLESTKACHLAGSGQTLPWIRRLAPLIENVTEYTDGDETNYIPKHLGEILAEMNPRQLYKYYFQNAKNEKLLLAEELFQYVIRSLGFNKDEDRALASTAISQGPFEELRVAAETNSSAKNCIDTIEDYFGNIEFSRNEYQTNPIIAEKPQDYSSISLEQLGDELKKYDQKYERNRYLANWLRCRTSVDKAEARKIYDTIISIIQEDPQDVESDLLDILYPMAFEFDNQKAFDLLCWAQANGYGWDRFFTSKQKTESRWTFLKEHYPERYLEFFEKSILYSGKRYGHGGTYFFPIPRGVEFLALFNDLKSMEEVAESGVSIVESLMANLKLPATKWVDHPEIDEFDILLQRLTWPSPFVRERAATAIAGLLNEGINISRNCERLLEWIKNQKLESIVAVGLLPILKALEKKGRLYAYIDLGGTINALPMTSIIIESLIQEIARLLGKHVDLTPNRRTILPAPDGYIPKEFFVRHIQGFLAPIYQNRAEEIRDETGFEFFIEWAYNSEELARECGIKEEIGDVFDFMGRDYPRITGLSSAWSEICRSAFLRILQKLHDENLIATDFYLEYSFATLPVELSYWKIMPNRAPEWWPRLKYSTPKDTYKKDIVQFSFQSDDIENIIQKREGTVLLGLDGAIQPKDGWREGVLDTSIRLLAFGYKVIGTDIPEARDVSREILYKPCHVIIPSRAARPFNILESFPEHLPMVMKPIKVMDLILHPLVGNLKDLAIALWQWFRGSRPFLILHYQLATNLEVKLEEKRFVYLRNGKAVAWSQDWLEGINEKTDLEIPHGTFIEIDSPFLNDYLDKNDLRLGYLAKTTYKFRTDRFDKEKIIEDYQLIGVSRIII
jgi:Cdc6-like AAA superfamily ATPase